MKKCTLLALLIAAVLTFSSCDPEEPLEPTSYQMRYTCCAYAVPGMFSSVYAGDAELMETDVYGRTLLKYRSFDETTRWWTNAFVICQRTANAKTFFYEDVCYLIEPRDGQSIAEAQLAELKARNDWNLPMNEEKMSYRKVPAESTWGDYYTDNGWRYQT